MPAGGAAYHKGKKSNKGKKMALARRMNEKGSVTEGTQRRALAVEAAFKKARSMG